MRGNHTFEIRFALATVLSAARESASEKNSQTTMPATANTGYGTPWSDGTFASRPRKTLNTTARRTGCSTAHATPTTDCL